MGQSGTPIKNQMIQLAPTMPAIHTSKLGWACIGDWATNKAAFEIVSRNNESVKVANWLICNSASELEPAAFSLFRNILPIGPLLSTNRHGKSAGSFWEEDSTCLEWLDQHPPDSVIYVAFGRPDPDHDHAFPDGFRDRVGNRGQIVGWAPQQQVLSHPSVACFLSHCGWNSTMEGVSNGVPFLCWPYFADQFLNQAYICVVWKVGLGFSNGDESGISKQGLIKDKVEQLLGDITFKERALDLKELTAKSVREGGCSYRNLNNFVEWMKALYSRHVLLIPTSFFLLFFSRLWVGTMGRQE
ncbi:unnamed protein product [Camellia sinensis]